MNMYYNPSTKEIKTRNELKILLHCSIPDNKRERIGEYFLIHELDIPVVDSAHRVVDVGVELKDGIYVRKYQIEEIEKQAQTTNEQVTNEQDKLTYIHNECDRRLSETDYMFNTDYDGQGHDNEKYMSALKAARSIWRKLRQCDNISNEEILEIPEIPKYKDYI